MTRQIRALGFPEDEVRARAAAAGVFPERTDYGTSVFGAVKRADGDPLDTALLVPPIFMPERLRRLIELGREPTHEDVDLTTLIGGFRSPLPLFVCAFGSTGVVSAGLGTALSRQAGRIGIPMVIGENVGPVNGYRRPSNGANTTLVQRIEAYFETAADGVGGVVVQQSTEDADAEMWNLLYSDPASAPFIRSGRVAFELKVGQGAKPGIGGMTIVDAAEASRLSSRYGTAAMQGDGESALRWASPGTFTDVILRDQVRMMRNNFPRARTWVKLPPGRDVAEAARVTWEAGADAVTVDGGEGGSGWAPWAFLEHVGLPLGECLMRIRPLRPQSQCLLASGRIWEGARAVKCLAMGARAVGLGRAALLAANENEDGLVNLATGIGLEMRMLISALGKYVPGALSAEDLFFSANNEQASCVDRRIR